MEKGATVMRIIDSKTAQVRVERETACGNCDSCGGTCSFRNVIYAQALNEVHASVGDRVTVESRSSSILKAAALIYIIPIICFLIAFAVAAAAGFSENTCLIFSLLGFLMGVGMSVLSQRIGKVRRITLIITEIK